MKLHFALILVLAVTKLAAQVDTLFTPVIYYDHKLIDSTKNNFDLKKLNHCEINKDLNQYYRPTILGDSCPDIVKNAFLPSKGHNDSEFDTAFNKWQSQNLELLENTKNEWMVTSAASSPVIIYDSLAFELNQNGFYQFARNIFHPLNGIGWDRVGKSRSLFAMEFHHSFNFVNGLRLIFSGTGECFIFVNGQAVFQTNFQNENYSHIIQLDSIPTLQNLGGKSLNLSFYTIFYGGKINRFRIESSRDTSSTRIRNIPEKNRFNGKPKKFMMINGRTSPRIINFKINIE